MDGPSAPATPPSPPYSLQLDSATPRIEPEVRERSLTSWPVIGSLIASLVIMGTITCARLYGSNDLSWATVTKAIQEWKARPEAAEQELPYVTSMPLVPGAGRSESIATEDRPAQPAKQVVLENPLRSDRSKDPNGKSDERR